MKKILLSSTLLLLLAVTIVPTYAFVIPPNPSSDDNNYELYGPHIPGIKFLTFADQTAELNAMLTGTALDLEDLPFNGPWVAAFGAVAGPWTEATCSIGGDTAFQNQPVEYSGGSGNQWVDCVNQAGVGVGSWWSTLDMYVQGETETTPYNVHYGLSTPVDSLNVLYAVSSSDIIVLSRMYDCGELPDPYTAGSFVPQLYKSWVTGTWLDPGTSTPKTYVTLTLRPDIYWQDGQPFTVADVYYTLVELSRYLAAKFDPNPTGPLWPAMTYVQDAVILDDYNIQILLNTNNPSLFVNVLENVIIPKHIWYPIVIGSLPGQLPSLFQPDGNCIGTGPFRYSFAITPSMVGGEIDLVANTPGSVVNGIPSPGYYFYCPIYVDITPTSSGGLSKINILPTQTSVTSTITLTTRNMYLSGASTFALTGNKAVYVNHLGAMPTPLTLLPMAPWNLLNPYPQDPLLHADIETLTLTLLKKTLTFIEVDFQVTGPATLPDAEANPWIGVWIKVILPLWVTIKEDIVGTNIYDVLGYTGSAYPPWLKSEAQAPDLKVDGKDIAAVAIAFGRIPGNPGWSPYADVNHDYRVDGKDIAIVAKQFGY